MMDNATFVFIAKSWGALYMLIFFLVCVIWTYWPSNREKYETAASQPLHEEDKPWQ